MAAANLWALVLAAGKGTRLYSQSPKVLRTILGEPMLGYVYSALKGVCQDRIMTVAGFGAAEVEQAFPGYKDNFVLQERQLGTGHALMVSTDSLAEKNATHCLVINGDTPLIDPEVLDYFVDQSVNTDISFMSIATDNPGGYGRVVRNDAGNLLAIIEAKDYDPNKYGPETGEVNAGIYFIRLDRCSALLSKLDNDNKAGEYYITDLVELALANGLRAKAVQCPADESVMGVNNAMELSRAEESLRAKIVSKHMEKGVVIHNPASVVIGPEVAIDPGVELYGPVEIYGKSIIRTGCVVKSNCVISSCDLYCCIIENFCHLEQALVGKGCSVGPYARLRPGAVLHETSKVGNFVEVKKSILHKGAKASHLTYLGDSEVGEKVNIGAGTITCNYDGVNKHKTFIGENSFIGSNTALVAPVNIGKGALVGAGSTITKDVGDNEMAIGRGKQKNLKRRPSKA